MTRLEEINKRKLEMRDEVEAAESEEKLEELNKEAEALKEEEEMIQEQESEEETSKEIEEKKFVIKEETKEEKKMNEESKKEFRKSKEYLDAYAEYLKGELVEDYKVSEEARALVTTGGYATGNTAVVEVPEIVDEIVRTAWEREELASLVRRIAVKGNYKVQFEVSGSDATIHQEGNGAVNEEELILGIVTIVPAMIKKWISVSDEVLSMRGQAFLEYIYDELTYKIAKKCVDTLITKIKQLPQSLSPNGDTGIYDTVSAAKITEAPAIDTIVKAASKLSDEANNITIVMNKETDAEFMAAQLAANYGIDVYRGYRVVYNNSLPAYSSATDGAVYAIVGDFGIGSIFNFPNGEGINIKYDDLTQMEYDLVRILGKEYVGIGVVADKAFALIAKPSTTPSA